MKISFVRPIFILQTDDTGLSELQQGGAIYLLGVIFFKLDGRLPLAHAIWHLHVVAASTIHYWAVAQYLIGPDSIEEMAKGQEKF